MTTKLSNGLIRVFHFLLRQAREIGEGGLLVLLRKTGTFLVIAPALLVVLLCDCQAVMDVVVSPMESRLLREAKKLGKKVGHGYEMSLHQAEAQFRLYTGVDAPLDVSCKAARCEV